ncbi:mitochondrial dynamics protein MID51-like [Oryzias latipes]|uniref:mitochondrial dynamics protein MID51-like n=1 Tax=Oryzias latipes TaxID=8090 RepID=UPI000CE2823C|nr:mitochondrial dynamics protein MID51-like [Oryzias latipes]
MARYLVGGYLSAEVVVNMFSKAVMETVNWPAISSTLDCLVRPVLGGPDLKLEIWCVSALSSCLSVCGHIFITTSVVTNRNLLLFCVLLLCFRPGSEEAAERCHQPLFISVLPILREGDVVLTAQPELTSPWVNAWRLSLYPCETQRLVQLDSTDDGCRRQTVKVLMAVCRLNPALRALEAAPLTNLVLHLSDSECDWSQNSLHARFQQCIAELIGYLEQGVLQSYFKPAVNLLSNLSEDQVDQIGFIHIAHITFCSLLPWNEKKSKTLR